MRPLELTVEGFKSYKDPSTFTFEGRTLIGIVGPTGAGKSSILEAIIFALYGKTPKVERDTKRLIYSGTDDARVQLAFDVDDSVWEVTRVLRRKGSAQVVLRRFGEDSPDCSGDRNVNARIEELLGLDFGAFCSSVVLPQGEFDRFLRATPAERSKILKGVFRLERVDALREVAKAKASEIGGRLSALRSELQLVAASPERLTALEDDLKEAKERATIVRERLETVGRAELEMKQAEESLRKIHEAVRSASAALERVPPESKLNSLRADEEESAKKVEAASGGMRSAKSSAESAEKALADVLKKTGGEDALGSAKSLIRSLSALEAKISDLKKRATEAQKESRESSALVTKLEAARTSADEQMSQARRALEELQRHHAAHSLRKGLKVGEACPVCEREILTVPSVGKLTALKTAEAKLAGAESNVRAATSELERAREEHARLKERAASSTKELELSKVEMSAIEAEIREKIGKVTDPAKEIAKRDLAVQTARKEVETTRAYLRGAESILADAKAAAEKVTVLKTKLAASIIQVCGWLRIDSPEIDASPEELSAAAKKAIEQGTELINAHYAEAQRVEANATDSSKLVEEFRREFDLDDGASVMKAMEDANARIGHLEREMRGLQEAIGRTKTIELEAGGLENAKALYDRLATDLTDARFTAYLLDWQRKLLARLGSEKLFELTGRYRFDEDGDFQIVDTALDEIRPSYTLSGGETFLASLALALALAEAVTLEGGPPGCFFLDEGFGTLDAEILDFALEGIESLAAPGRLIGLISHHGAVQARLDDLIVLDKVGDGTTTVVQTEGPLAYAAVGI